MQNFGKNFYDMVIYAGLSEVIKSHTFVGMADEIKALIQHGTRLYLANTTRITQEMFYQQVRSAFCKNPSN